MSKNPPVFRQISAPLDVSDDDLNALGDKLGVPTMVKPETPPAPAVAVKHENPANASFATGQAAPTPFPASPVSLPPKIGIRTLPVRPPTEKITVELPSYLAARCAAKVLSAALRLGHWSLWVLSRSALRSKTRTLSPTDAAPARSVAHKAEKPVLRTYRKPELQDYRVMHDQ